MVVNKCDNEEASAITVEEINQWVLAAQKGDKKALGRVLMFVMPHVMRVARFWESQYPLLHETADDLTQEALIRIMDYGLPRFDPEKGNFLSFCVGQVSRSWLGNVRDKSFRRRQWDQRHFDENRLIGERPAWAGRDPWSEDDTEEDSEDNSESPDEEALRYLFDQLRVGLLDFGQFKSALRRMGYDADCANCAPVCAGCISSIDADPNLIT